MISVVIPTYNNTRQLIADLKNNMRYLVDNEIIVVNDFPEISIAKDISQFPEIKLIENEQNLGFAGAVHKAISASSYKYVMLLNDDVVLNDSSYQKAIVALQTHPELFAVSFAQKEKDEQIVGKNMFYWKDGFFHHEKANDLKPGMNGWAEGGSCIIDKDKYVKIGGFDSLYAPFYWEDVDLSYRAWKHGYSVLFDPTIIVIHHHESTIGRQFEQKKVHSIAYRNQFVFIWKNITDIKLIISHKLNVIKMFIPMFFKDEEYVRGFFMALRKLPEILHKKYKSVLSDREILEKFKT